MPGIVLGAGSLWRTKQRPHPLELRLNDTKAGQESSQESPAGPCPEPTVLSSVHSSYKPDSLEARVRAAEQKQPGDQLLEQVQ